MSFFSELKRRNVFRVAAAYIVVGWLLMQVADVLQNALELPTAFSKALLAVLAIGFIPVLVFSWVYEMTPEGLKRESKVPSDTSITHHTARKLDMVVIGLLMVAISLFVLDRYMGTPEPPRTPPPSVAEAPTTEESAVPVVAVLPLKALSTEDEGKFLAFGLHDDLLTRLAKLQAFKVISRTSVMEYADTAKNMRQIGQELGAGYIVEGGLQAIGGRVSINAQLIDADTDEHLWAETWNRELTTANLFDVQSEIATAIANALHATLAESDMRLLRDVPTDNLQAYRAYLRGLDLHGLLTRPALLETVASLEEAVRLDPDFTEAWALLSRAYMRRYWEEGGEYDADPDPGLLALAREALDRAVALDPDNVEVHFARAFYHYYALRDYEAALAELQKAATTAPHHSLVTALRGFLLRRLGQLDEAADHLLRIAQYDPHNQGAVRETIITLTDAGRCEEARTLARDGLETFPDASGVLAVASVATLVCGEDPADALALAEGIEVTTRPELQAKVDVRTHAGDYDGAIQALLGARAQFAEDRLMSLTIENQLASLYRVTGRDEAFDATLQRAARAADEVEASGASALVALAHYAALTGDAGRTLELGNRAREAFPRDLYVVPTLEYELLEIYSLAGDAGATWDLFADWAARAWYTELYVTRASPFLEGLRADPRFEATYARAIARYN